MIRLKNNASDRGILREDGAIVEVEVNGSRFRVYVDTNYNRLVVHKEFRGNDLGLRVIPRVTNQIHIE